MNGTRLFFDVDGPELVPHGDEMETRPVVVLVHGGPGAFDHSLYKQDLWQLTNVAQVVYLDLRGHGRSAHDSDEPWSLELWADDVRAFCEALGIDRPVVWGHSFGSFVAATYAARHPEHLRALVRGCSLLRRSTSPTSWGRIRCPTLVCAGDLDPLTQVVDAREVVAAIGEHRARLEVFEQAGHYAFKDVADRYWPTVRGFITEAAATGAGGTA